MNCVRPSPPCGSWRKILSAAKIPDPEKQNEYFRFIVQECRRLSSLIENVLDFSRIEQGRKQYEFEPTNLIGADAKR